MPSAELRLGLSGRALVFGDGAPYCLVCGARPFGRRSIPCRDADYARRKSQNLNSILEWLNPALAYFNWRRKVSFAIDAPLCVRHFWRARPRLCWARPRSWASATRARRWPTAWRRSSA